MICISMQREKSRMRCMYYCSMSIMVRIARHSSGHSRERTSISSIRRKRPVCVLDSLIHLVRELLKEKSTPVGEIQAYLKDISLRNQPAVSSDMLVSLNEPKWEFKPFGSRRVVCFPPGNRDNIEYLPWVGYREGNCVRLFNFVGTGFRPKRVEAGTEVNSMEVERDEVHEEQDEEQDEVQDEVQDVQDPILNVGMCVDPWEYDIRNTFAYL